MPHSPDTAPAVLVLNAGSSSLKYRSVNPVTGDAQVHGTIERIGEADVPDHETAVRQALEHVQRATSTPPVAVGHRVVHGGSRPGSRGCAGERGR
jgi:acetate kinase